MNFTVITPPRAKAEVINPQAQYKIVMLGDRDNLDGSRDLVLWLTGDEVKRLIEIVKEREVK